MSLERLAAEALIQKEALLTPLPLRMVCPWCNGGRSHEASLTVSVYSNQLSYKCFRNRCGKYGYIGGVPSTNVVAKIKNNDIKLELEPLTISQQQHLPVIDLSLAPLWWPERSSVMYQVHGYWGKPLGYVQRRYDALAPNPKGYPKALNVVLDDSEPFVHFPHLTSSKFSDTLYIVEDIPSSEAINQYRCCAALLGTGITASTIDLFMSIGVKHLVICLDNDAIGTAIRLRRRLALAFESVIVQFVDKDPKDMTEEELRNAFEDPTPEAEG